MVVAGEEIEEGEGMQIVLDEQGQERSVQYIEEEHAEYPGGTMEVIHSSYTHLTLILHSSYTHFTLILHSSYTHLSLVVIIHNSHITHTRDLHIIDK